jgi:septal ring factor EnvC (AmiA/AmiB activator)
MDQSSEQSPDRSMDQDSGRWLTYPELAGVRDIDKPSAIRLATRKKWRRQRDNRRVVRVLVPPEWLTPRYQSTDLPMDRQDRDMDLSSDRTDFAAALAAVESAHAGEIAALHGQVAGLKTLVDQTMAALADANSRTDRSEAEIRELRGQIEALHRQLVEAQRAVEGADELRRQDDTRRAMGRWARLRAAWRGG